MGLFRDWQGAYAEHNTPTFPVRFVDGDKRPMIGGYAKLGLKGSRALADKFPDADSFGFMVRKARVTILDVDTNDERVLADALDRHGQTPLLVRTQSGGFHAYYRNGGEPRSIRPWGKSRPIDLLGDGYVLGAPSKGARGWYVPVQGTVDDLACLPPLTGLAHDQGVAPDGERIGKGKRGDALFRYCMQTAAKGCVVFSELLERATAFAATELEPHPDPITASDVKRAVKSALSYTERGLNRFGGSAHVLLGHDVVDRYAACDPDALALLVILKRHHWNREGGFVIAKPAMAESLDWSPRRLLHARTRLVDDGLIRCINRGGRGVGDAARFEWVEPPALSSAIPTHNKKHNTPPSLSIPSSLTAGA